ncbi:UNVERIFIED_ORG: pimeloyl-ACP methyl ester carboxylesterase [Gordonia westfalica J30]
MQTLDIVDADTGVDYGRGVHLDVRVAGGGDRTALVLPGAERTRENDRFIAELANEFEVVVPSHPGFGRSPRPEWCSTVHDLADIYVDWLNRGEHSDVTLVGLQFGGWVALEVALRTTRITHLALVDPVGVKFGGPLDRDIVDVFAMQRAELEQRLYHDPRSRLGDLGNAPVEDVLEMARNEEGLAVYGWEPYLHNPNLGRSLRDIDVPTVVVWGAEDGVVTPAYGRALSERIPGSRFELVDLAGHRAQVDRPDAVAKLITQHSS